MTTSLSATQQAILLDSIRSIPDYPKPGILFKDVSTLLNNSEALQLLVAHLKQYYQATPIDFIAGIESRGFIFGAMLAYALGKGFVPIRKPKKLPCKTYSCEYDLEYGKDRLEIHCDAFSGTQSPQVLLVDDLIATGGSANASLDLIAQAGGHCVGACFIIQLQALAGFASIRDKVPSYAVLSC